MSIKGIRLSVKSLRGLAPLGMTLMIIAMVGGPAIAGAAAQDKLPEAPLVQQFEDVPDSYTFAQYINALYLDGIISGYPCGGAGEPCGPGNLPYYRPSAGVTRGQMSKFVDLGRRNIADAVGSTLVLSTTAFNALDAVTNSGGEAVDAFCITPGTACYAVQGNGVAGNTAGYFSAGARGVYASASDADGLGVQGRASGASAYAGYFISDANRAVYAESNHNGRFSMYVAAQDGPTQGTAALNVYGPGRVEGILYALGGCSGCTLSNVVLNVDSSSLEAGDVVSIVGSAEAVQGDVPVVTVKKVAQANDTGVVGIVDGAFYVPDADTRDAYAAQEQAIHEARELRGTMEREATGGNKINLADYPIPAATISDEQGTAHLVPGVTSITTKGYASVVTQGVYKAVKVDASFGAIKAGDLLTTSPNPGYAMKVTDKAEAMGAIIGKALGDLSSGTGTVPVMVTLK